MVSLTCHISHCQASMLYVSCLHVFFSYLFPHRIRDAQNRIRLLVVLASARSEARVFGGLWTVHRGLRFQIVRGFQCSSQTGISAASATFSLSMFKMNSRQTREAFDFPVSQLMEALHRCPLCSGVFQHTYPLDESTRSVQCPTQACQAFLRHTTRIDSTVAPVWGRGRVLLPGSISASYTPDEDDVGHLTISDAQARGFAFSEVQGMDINMDTGVVTCVYVPEHSAQDMIPDGHGVVLPEERLPVTTSFCLPRAELTDGQGSSCFGSPSSSAPSSPSSRSSAREPCASTAPSPSPAPTASQRWFTAQRRVFGCSLGKYGQSRAIDLDDDADAADL